MHINEIKKKSAAYTDSENILNDWVISDDWELLRNSAGIFFEVTPP